MKLNRALALIVLFLSVAHADNPPPNAEKKADPFAAPALAAANDAPPNVQIDAEFIEAPEAVVSSILHCADAPKSGAQWKAVVEKLVKEEKGKITASLTVTTKSGQRATAESAKELTYPVEFDPANGRKADAPAVPKSLTGADVPTPTAFEMRSVGVRMEVEATVGNEGIIDLNLAPEMTAKVDDVVHQEIPLGNEKLATIKQPAFYTMKTTTAVAVTAGGSALAAIFVPHRDKGEPDSWRRVLCLVTARLIAP